MSVFELYKPFRNNVASLAYDDAFYVIWAYSQYLQINGFQVPHDIEVLEGFRTQNPPQAWISEWELELLAKEVIINASPASARGRTLRSWDTLSEVLNQLKNLENEIYGLFEYNNVFIELIRVAHRQFGWQSDRPNAVTIIRYFKIFSDPAIDEVCNDVLGLSVRQIYLCGLCFMGHFLSKAAMAWPIAVEIPGISEQTFQRFLSFTSRTIDELKPVLRSEQKYDDRFSYSFSSLRAFPLVHMQFYGRPSIACPIPTLLLWRITNGLYYELVGDDRFSQALGNSFQTYAGEAIRKACRSENIQTLEEIEYGPKQARKRSTDWIVCKGDAAIFLECKSKRLSWAAKSSLDDLAALQADIDSLAGAVVQVYKTILDYEQGLYGHFPVAPDRKIYPVIVTLENWHAFGNEFFNRLHSSVSETMTKENLSDKYLDQMPYSIWSAGDLENGLQVINSVGIRDFFDGKINDVEMNTWDWRGYIGKRFAKSMSIKKLFGDEYDDVFSKIMAEAEF